MTWVLPGATFRPVVNRSAGNRNPTIGVIVHCTTGTSSPFPWFNNPAAQASSTWFVAYDGSVEQYVDPDTEHAWAQGAGNRDYHSIEFEGGPSDPMTDAQLRAGGHILAEGHKRWGWPLVITNTVGAPGLGVHQMGGQAWGGHTCPDPAYGFPGPRSKQRPQIIAYAQAELNPSPTPIPVPQKAPEMDLSNPADRMALAELLRENIGDIAAADPNSWWFKGIQTIVAETMRENIGDLAVENPNSWLNKAIDEALAARGIVTPLSPKSKPAGS